MAKLIANSIMLGKIETKLMICVDKFQFLKYFFVHFAFRLFGTKCDKCGNSFSKNDYVMRAKTKIYHTECFRCFQCSVKLIPGKIHLF